MTQKSVFTERNYYRERAPYGWGRTKMKMRAAVFDRRIALFDNTPNVLPFIKTGRMRALAVTSAQRSPLLPEIPTIAEKGYPGFEVSVWYGLVVPAGTPRDITTKLNVELNKVLQSEDVKKIFAEQGVVPVGGSVDETKKFFQSQMGVWSKVIRQAEIRAD